MATKTFGDLHIKADTTGADDHLRLVFLGDFTMTTTGWIKIDGVNGPVIVEIDGGTLQTS